MIFDVEFDSLEQSQYDTVNIGRETKESFPLINLVYSPKLFSN